jgi:6-phosphogluconolactonase
LKPFELISFGNADELAQAVASAWLDEVGAASRAGQPHCVALSGGRIAQKLFAFTTHHAKLRGTNQRHVHFFWADERCVPPEDVDSNFRMARGLLFVPMGIAEFQVHRIRGEEQPEVAATKAGEEIRRVARLNDAGQPVLDLVLLGMGEDGHVASLFPGEPQEVRFSQAVYRAIRNSPKPPAQRVTLGYNAIAAARAVWVLVSGAGKEAALHKSLQVSGSTPLATVLGQRTQTRIWSDLAT